MEVFWSPWHHVSTSLPKALKFTPRAKNITMTYFLPVAIGRRVRTILDCETNRGEINWNAKRLSSILWFPLSLKRNVFVSCVQMGFICLPRQVYSFGFNLLGQPFEKIPRLPFSRVGADSKNTSWESCEPCTVNFYKTWKKKGKEYFTWKSTRKLKLLFFFKLMEKSKVGRQFPGLAARCVSRYRLLTREGTHRPAGAND